ncbi:MAG: hypothetical protein CV081_02890, partial [Nitrospira sp. LK265]|nr:hypothetical protein [Nitrospira sp. LK265]
MNDSVAAWLESLGLARYRELFEQNAITWDVLSEVNDDDLASMGIVLGHRKQLLRAMAQLSPKGESGTATSSSITTSKDTTSSSS